MGYECRPTQSLVVLARIKVAAPIRRDDGLAGLSTISAALYDGSVRGMLDRLKDVRGRRVPSASRSIARSRRAALVHVSFVRQPDEDPTLPRAPAQCGLTISLY